jgi:general secretion pathway protein A
MYEAHFGLTGRPFLTAPDPQFLYWTDAHTYAFTMMRYGLMSRAPIVVITGEIGAGKTTLLRQLLREAPSEVMIGLMSNILPDRGQLLHWAMMALGQPVGDESYVMLFQRFQDFVIRAYAQGRRVVLTIDEAQNLSIEQLEELRMLSNINADGDELLQLVLVGQPQLRDKLALPELVQLRQRVALDFHLTAMSADELDRYVRHRLDVVGARWRIFTAQSCRLIHAATGGVPRLVNILCDMCLVYGYAAESKVIEEPLVREFLLEARRRGIFQQFTPLPDAPTLAARP